MSPHYQELRIYYLDFCLGHPIPLIAFAVRFQIRFTYESVNLNSTNEAHNSPSVYRQEDYSL